MFNPQNLRPPSPLAGPSNRSSANSFGSQDNLLPGRVADDGPAIPGPGSIPGAPPQTREVQIENPAEATNSPIKSFKPYHLQDEEDPEKYEKYNDLKFWPTILKKRAVAALVSIYLATAVSLGVLIWRSYVEVDHSFRLSSENVRMISRYFPSIVGTVTVLLFRQTVREALRMEPFTKMADQKHNRTQGTRPAIGVGGAWFPWQSFTTTPKSFLSIFSLVCQIIVSFVVSFKAALLASSDLIEGDQHYWLLTVRFYPALFLIGMYIAMIIYTLYISYRFRRKSTGLKWDPISIADYASLFAHCNALEFFAPLELWHDLRPEHVMTPDRKFRLGYWKVRRVNSPNEEVVYGIGVGFDPERDHDERQEVVPLEDQQQPQEPVRGPPQRQYSYKHRPWYHKVFHRRQEDPPLPMGQCLRTTRCSHGLYPGCEHYPYNHSPGCSRWVIIVSSIFPIAALVGSIYLLAIRKPFDGFVLNNNIKIPSTFTWSVGSKNHTLPPIDPADPNSNILLWALMFRSAPTYVAGIFTSTIITWIDLNMRFMQPFRNMCGGDTPKSKSGNTTNNTSSRRRKSSSLSHHQEIRDEPVSAKASESILLSYLTVSPLQVPLTAWGKSHFKVCIYSTLNTISPLFPIFVGGLLTIQPIEDLKQVQFIFSLSAYVGVMVLLSLYSILVPLAFPRSTRLLPRQLYSLADLMALCHESKFMESLHLDIADRGRTPSKEHMEARILLDDARFLFGQYKGRDKHWHIGFDVTHIRGENFGNLKPIPDSVRFIERATVAEKIRRATTLLMEEGNKIVEHMAGHSSKKKKDAQNDSSIPERNGYEPLPRGEASGSQFPAPREPGLTRLPRLPTQPDMGFELEASSDWLTSRRPG